MAKDTAQHMADCIEDLLKFLRVSVNAGPMSCNPRTEIYHLTRLRHALEAHKASQSSQETAVEAPELEPIHVAGPGTPIIGHRVKGSRP